MKIKFLRPALSFAARSAAWWVGSAVAAIAAPLTTTTAVHTQPDTSSPAITFLKAGTEPVAATGTVGMTPAGWMAVQLPGPFEAYVENKDLAKNLDVKRGAPMRLAPKVDAGILATAEKDDKTTITGLRGKWTQISLEKNLTGYINLGVAPGYLPPIATTPAGAGAATTPPAAATNPTPVSVAPVAPPADLIAAAPANEAALGQPAPMVNLGDGGASALSRQFTGKFLTTRRPLTPRRPYDWALHDDTGKRFAYLDVSKLPASEQIERYANHYVFVFGNARGTVDGKELVIQIESVQLR